MKKDFFKVEKDFFIVRIALRKYVKTQYKSKKDFFAVEKDFFKVGKNFFYQPKHPTQPPNPTTQPNHPTQPPNPTTQPNHPRTKTTWKKTFLKWKKIFL